MTVLLACLLFFVVILHPITSILEHFNALLSVVRDTEAKSNRKLLFH